MLNVAAIYIGMVAFVRGSEAGRWRNWLAGTVARPGPHNTVHVGPHMAVRQTGNTTWAIEGRSVTTVWLARLVTAVVARTILARLGARSTPALHRPVGLCDTGLAIYLIGRLGTASHGWACWPDHSGLV